MQTVISLLLPMIDTDRPHALLGSSLSTALETDMKSDVHSLSGLAPSAEPQAILCRQFNFFLTGYFARGGDVGSLSDLWGGF